jgi:hypothetical protein
MRKLSIIFLLLFLTGLTYAQPSLLVPAKTTSVLLTTTRPTFKWSQVAGATVYQLYYTSSTADTTFANSQSSPSGSKKFVTVGTRSTDTTYTIADTILAKNTQYYWKARAKVNGTWSAWSYPFSYFKIGAPNYSMSNANEVISFNHDTLSAITGVRYFQGSGNQILDTVYNSANSLGLGGNGVQPDTVVSWYTSANTDTNIFTYQNGVKYGTSGSKVMTVSRGASGITANISVTLENSKSINIATAWTPGGDASGNTDNVLLVNSSGATKTSLTYPGSAASFGPDSITLSAMYDTRYGEYFGFKSSSPIAVSDTQVTGSLRQILSFSNTTGSNATFIYSFAVRQTRAAYFDTWANNRPIFVTKPAAGDSLVSPSTYVVWESFGVNPNSVSFSSDSGATFGNAAAISNDTTSVDSVQYTMPNGPTRNNCIVKVTSSQGDAGKSGVFKVAARELAVTSPKAGDIVSAGKNYIVWTNPTGSGVSAVEYSIDSGATWIGTIAISPADSAAADSVLYDFSSAKTASANSMVRIRTNAADTAVSGIFTLGKGGATFSIPMAFGSPNGQVVVSIRVKDYVVGDSIKSFDLKMNFDSTYVQFDSLTYAPLLQSPHWITAMDSSNTKTTDSNYVRLAAFMAQTGYGIKDSAIASLYFTVRNKQSIIGAVSSLSIKNSVLAASGNGAASLDVSGSTNGVLKIYSSISGVLRYLHEDTVTASYSISGDSLIVYKDITDSTNNAFFDVAGGQFNLTNRPPHDSVNFYPSASVYTDAGLSSIDVIDARLAFLDFLTPLSTRAKIAADVNEDSVVNSTDAEMIMNISVDSTYLKGIGLSNWVFADSANLASVEHASDSLSAWWTADKHSISYTLVNQQTNQDFFGVLRGDVDFSYGASQDVNTNMNTIKNPTKNPGTRTITSSPILFSTSASMGIRPGDTVWIPLNINPGEAGIGGFNASVKVDPKIFTYTGKFTMGQSMPQKSNWYIAAKSDAVGKLSIAATDFSVVIAPIAKDGTALAFQFAVNPNVELGTSSTIGIQTETVIDPKMHRMSTQTQNGEVQVSSDGVVVPKEYELSQNYPNPFNPSTTIRYGVPMDSKVDIVIYNVLGQRVATLVSGTLTAGYHNVVWNAGNLSSGVYFSVMRCTSISTGKDFRSVKKLMLLK